MRGDFFLKIGHIEYQSIMGYQKGYFPNFQTQESKKATTKI
jgi:hypothetical protein